MVNSKIQQTVNNNRENKTMNIGLTYDLKSAYLAKGFTAEEAAEFDSEETVAALQNTIQECGHTVERIGNIFDLTEALASGKRWDLVFNIAEGMYGRGREAQIPALLEAYSIPFTFSDSFIMALTLDKSATKRYLRDMGVPTGDFWVAMPDTDITLFDIEFPVFIKPIAEGTGKGIRGKSRANNFVELLPMVANLIQEFNQAVLIEEYLPGREFTVGILGTGSLAKVIGNIEIIFTDPKSDKIYNYETKMDYENQVIYRPCKDDFMKKINRLALETYIGLNCRDAGRVDIRLDKNNEPVFIEINPLAGLNPIHSDLPILAKLNGMEYKELINRIIESAKCRIVK